MNLDQTRRFFLTQAGASLGMLWLSSLTPDLLAQAHAHAKATPPSPTGALRFFAPGEAADFDAFSSQIIPTDDTPGAREANVVHCVDYLLSALDQDQQTPFRNALKKLNEQATAAAPGAKPFAALTSAQQIGVMKGMEKSPEFGMLRGWTVTAFFCDPALGGNKDQVGWKLLDFDSTFLFQPPFGYYDAHPDEEKA